MGDVGVWFMTVVMLVGGFLLFMDREMYPKEIEAAYEVCDNANSKLKRMDATLKYNTVHCESGATFKLLSDPYMEKRDDKQ